LTSAGRLRGRHGAAVQRGGQSMKAIAVASMIVGVLVAGAAPTQQQASSTLPVMTAGDLQDLCAGADHVSRNSCRIYILGVTQGIAVGLRLAARGSHGARPCTPADIPAETLEQTVKERLGEQLRERPARHDAEASQLIGTVLTQAFPCTGARP
jgi:hypothetical protein